MNILITEEEKLLVRKAEDKAAQAEKRYEKTFTGFLNEREQEILLSNVSVPDGIVSGFYGGYPDAERRMMFFMPEYAEETEVLSVIRASYYKDNELSHRDFLGAITALGVSRDVVGDILVFPEEHSADIIVKNDIKEFLLSELKTAGRAALKLSVAEPSELRIPPKRTETLTDTVASPRLDSVLSCGLGVSRENAVSVIKSGKVSMDRRLCTENDIHVPDGALINARGYGKFKVYVSANKSKKGRIFITIEKYI